MFPFPPSYYMISLTEERGMPRYGSEHECARFRKKQSKMLLSKKFFGFMICVISSTSPYHFHCLHHYNQYQYVGRQFIFCIVHCPYPEHWCCRDHYFDHSPTPLKLLPQSNFLWPDYLLRQNTRHSWSLPSNFCGLSLPFRCITLSSAIHQCNNLHFNQSRNQYIASAIGTKTIYSGESEIFYIELSFFAIDISKFARL